MLNSARENKQTYNETRKLQRPQRTKDNNQKYNYHLGRLDQLNTLHPCLWFSSTNKEGLLHHQERTSSLTIDQPRKMQAYVVMSILDIKPENASYLRWTGQACVSNLVGMLTRKRLLLRKVRQINSTMEESSNLYEEELTNNLEGTSSAVEDNQPRKLRRLRRTKEART